MWTLCWWAYGQRVKLQFSSSVLRLPAVIFITHFICYCFVYFTRGVQLRGGGGGYEEFRGVSVGFSGGVLRVWGLGGRD